MTGQQLKNSILQMAVQGKLVPQDPNDEPASELLKRIRAEKERLIKEGKIKREKNPSVIFKGPDNLPYEKVGKNAPVCIADEVPFEIPDSWEWVHPSDIGFFESGKTPSPNQLSECGTIPYFKVADMNTTGNEKYLRYSNSYLKTPNSIKLFAKDSIVYPKNGGALFTNKKRILWQDSLVDLNTGSYTQFSHINKKYFYYLFATIDFKKHCKGTALPTVDMDSIQKIIWALPPLAEQRRIVSAIESVESSIHDYSIKEEAFRALNKAFPEALKKSILQEAVQGKLVPQDPSDEPASVLLERIRTEKERLVKEGKIKRDKHESVIFRRGNSHYEKLDGREHCIDDEIPFEIPDGWEWVRMGTLFQVNPRNQLSDDLDAGFVPMPLLSEGFANCHSYEIKKWKDIKSGFTHFANGDIVIAKITPCFQNRKSAVICNLPNGYGAGTTELHVLRDTTGLLFMQYFLEICKTHAFIESGMKHFSGTAGQQRIGKEFISEYLIPVPTLNEQKRIVNAIDRAFGMVNKLENN